LLKKKIKLVTSLITREWNPHKLPKPMWILSNNSESVGKNVLIVLLFELGRVWINNLFAAYITGACVSSTSITKYEIKLNCFR